VILTSNYFCILEKHAFDLQVVQSLNSSWSVAELHYRYDRESLGWVNRYKDGGRPTSGSNSQALELKDLQMKLGQSYLKMVIYFNEGISFELSKVFLLTDRTTELACLGWRFWRF